MQKKSSVDKGLGESLELKEQKQKKGNGAKPEQEASTPDAGADSDRRTRNLLRRFEYAVRMDPEEAANWYNLGRLYLDLGDNRRAEAMLKQAVRREPDAANYRFHLGGALGHNGKLVEAADHFRSLANVDPGLRDPMSVIGLSALSHLAYCQGGMGDWDAAFTTLQPAVGVAISILRDLARFLLRSGDYERSCFLFTVALFLAPDDAELRHGAGYCHMKVGRLEFALEQLRKAVKAGRENPDIWYDLGRTLAKMRNGKKARPCFRKALELDPKHFRAWYALACLDALENKPNAAFRNLYKSIECGFKDREYLLKDPDFAGIHKDPRWKLVLRCISAKGGGETPDQDPQLHAAQDPDIDATLGRIQ